MPATTNAAFQLKGTAATLTVLRLQSTDVTAIEQDLLARVGQLPHFFHNAPVVVDLQDLAEDQAPAFDALVAALKRCHVVPVAIRNATGEHLAHAIDAGLGQLKGGRLRTPKAPETPEATFDKEPKASAAESRVAESQAADSPQPATGPDTPPVGNPPMQLETAAPPPPSLMIKNPVRSGQVTYAQQTDLVLLGPVNPGAEVIADGSIHAYGPLRGRALAGAHGNQEARIFCHSLDAELVSICGHYLRADEIPAELRNKPAQVILHEGALKVMGM